MGALPPAHESQVEDALVGVGDFVGGAVDDADKLAGVVAKADGFGGGLAAGLFVRGEDGADVGLTCEGDEGLGYGDGSALAVGGTARQESVALDARRVEFLWRGHHVEVRVE